LKKVLFLVKLQMNMALHKAFCHISNILGKNNMIGVFSDAFQCPRYTFQQHVPSLLVIKILSRPNGGSLTLVIDWVY
jgi:hypothetical protein